MRSPTADPQSEYPKIVGLKIVIKGMKVEDRNGMINIKTAHTHVLTG